MAKAQKEKPQDLKFIKKVLSPHCDFAFILGSYGTPRFNDSSDIDIAANFRELPGLDLRLKLMSELSAHFDRDVDLAPLNSVDPIFGRQVVETGRVIFCDDPGLMLGWKANILSVYPDFKRSRAIIEANLLRKKKDV